MATSAYFPAVRHGFRALVALAVALPVTCFGVLLAIPFLVPGADWDGSLDRATSGLSLAAAASASAGLIALALADVLASSMRTSLKPRRWNRRWLPRRLLSFSLAVGLVVLAIECALATRLILCNQLASMLIYSVSTDSWNGVSMLLPVELTVGAILVLGFGMLHQCNSLRGARPIARPVWPPCPASPEEQRSARAEVRKMLLFPIKRRLGMLKSNWLYIGLPTIAVLWLAWLASQTANTQLLPLPVDVSCILFIAACWQWCVRFSKTVEICHQLAADLEGFTKRFSDPVAKWTSILQRMGTPETGGLTLLWSRHQPARLERMDRTVQRLAAAKKIGQPELIDAAAEELYALRIEAYVRQVFRQEFRLFAGLMLAACLLLLTSVSFPFNTEPLLRLTTAMMLFAASLVMCWYYVKFDRQPLVSLLVGTQPGRVDWNWSMLHTVIPPLALGLFAMLGQVFPEIWSWVAALLDPLSRSTG